jgi:hypothetical protein
MSTTDHYDPTIEDSEQVAQESRQRLAGAQQDAQNAQQRSAQETENGEPLSMSTDQIENKIRGGLMGTENALHLLGASQPYQPASY